MLPECAFRGVQTVDAKNRQCYQCTHPKMLQGAPVTLVRESNCLECQYASFDAAYLKSHYRQHKPKWTEPAVFAERVDKCDECEHRAGNYCRSAGGCGLTHKLRVRGFSCPEGKFNGG